MLTMIRYSLPDLRKEYLKKRIDYFLQSLHRETIKKTNNPLLDSNLEKKYRICSYIHKIKSMTFSQTCNDIF